MSHSRPWLEQVRGHCYTNGQASSQGHGVLDDRDETDKQAAVPDWRLFDRKQKSELRRLANRCKQNNLDAKEVSSIATEFINRTVNV